MPGSLSLRSAAGQDGVQAPIRSAPRSPAAPVPRVARNWALEVRALSACDDLASAWSRLGRRALITNPFFDPGFLLPASQHLVAFRDLRVLLVWKATGAAPERELVALMPFRRQGRMLRPDLVTGCADPRLLSDMPLLDREGAVPALAALLRGFGSLGMAEHRLTLHGLASDNPLLATLAAAALPLWRIPSPPPADRPGFGPVPDGFTVREAANLTQLRDAVEILLALEASGPLARAGGACLQDVREAAFLRTMTRQLARSKLCQVTLLLQGEQPVAGALTLGRGKRRWLFKLAVEAGQHPDAAAILPVLMCRSTPGLALLGRGDRLLGPEVNATAVWDVDLIRAAPRRPADLARGLRARIDRALFSPRRAAAGE